MDSKSLPWLPYFSCHRDCLANFTVNHYGRSSTGRMTEALTCEKCQDRYTVYWVADKPLVFITAKREIAVKLPSGRITYRTWNGHDLPDDLAHTLASVRHDKRV